MKKLFVILFAAALLLCSCANPGGSSSAPEDLSAAQTEEQLKVAALELEALEPVRKMRDMERYAARESDDLRRYVAFVSLYAPVLALDDAAAKKYVQSPVVPDDEDFRLKVNAVVSPYGAEYLEDGFYYADYAAVVKLAPFIAARLDALGVDK